ncbi:MAG: lipopolysaccharide biosynthesis protein RfbH [Candidatus Magasanikbacteria bacterium]
MDQAMRDLLINYCSVNFTKKRFIAGESSVPINGKVFDEHEIINMVEAVLDGWWTEGRFSALFEQRIGNWLGVKYSALTNSGSSANLLALSALTSLKLKERRIEPGSEIITVAAGFPTTINPIIQNGCIPVFVDVEIGSYNAIVDQIQEAVGPKTRAVFLAHTLGNPFDVDSILEICKKNNLWLIEDNCDALGSVYHGKKTGTFGHIATCSFYPAHHITMGEGGAVFTNDALLYRIVRSIRDWGRDCWCNTGQDNTCGKRFGWQLGNLPFGYDHKFIYSEIGYNLKTTDIQAALGLSQFDKLENFIEMRKKNFTLLYNHLKKYEKFFVLPTWLDGADSSWFGFLLTVRQDSPFTRSDIIEHLQNKKIATRFLFAGNILRQPYFVERNIIHKSIGNLENTDYIMNNTFWVGCYPGITSEMLQYMTEMFDEFLMKY